MTLLRANYFAGHEMVFGLMAQPAYRSLLGFYFPAPVIKFNECVVYPLEADAAMRKLLMITEGCTIEEIDNLLRQLLGSPEINPSLRQRLHQAATMTVEERETFFLQDETTRQALLDENRSKQELQDMYDAAREQGSVQSLEQFDPSHHVVQAGGPCLYSFYDAMRFSWSQHWQNIQKLEETVQIRVEISRQKQQHSRR